MFRTFQFLSDSPGSQVVNFKTLAELISQIYIKMCVCVYVCVDRD